MGPSKTATLLAYLSCRPEKSASHSECRLVLYPLEGIKKARVNFNEFLTDLWERHDEHNPKRRPLPLRKVLYRDPKLGVWLDRSVMTTDLDDFLQLLGKAETGDDAWEREQTLIRALDLYRLDKRGGELLSEFAGDWVTAKRADLAARYFGAIDRLVELLLNRDEREQARQYLERAICAEPSEEGRRQFHDQMVRLGPRRRPDNAGRLIGREQEIKNLVHSLVGENTSSDIEDTDTVTPRLVLLWGPPGIGKTRLAQKLGERLRSHFPGGVRWVALERLTRASQMLPAIRDALRLPTAPGEELTDQIIAYLQRRRTLLIIDNLEGVGGEGVHLLRLLAQRVPNLCCLAISWNDLNLGYGPRIRLTPLQTVSEDWTLSPGEAERSEAPDRLRTNESVKLFLYHVRKTKPGYSLTSRNAETVARLCHHLEGNPLAIVLAANQAGKLTPKEMLEKLSRRFELLVNQADTGRHRSLHAVVGMSYTLLSLELRMFLARLSYFRGGWTAEAAMAIWGGDSADAASQTYDFLVLLHSYSLVEIEDKEDEQRWRLSDTLRDFAAEQLRIQKAEQMTHRRHARFFVALAKGAAPLLQSSEQEPWLDRLSCDHANLRVALEWTSTWDVDACLDLVESLLLFWDSRGYWDEAREWIGWALERVEPGSRSHAALLLSAGRLSSYQGQYEEADLHIRASLTTYERMGDPSGCARAYQHLAGLAIARGDKRAAAEHLSRSREIFDADGTLKETVDFAALLEIEITLAIQQDRYEDARPLLDRCLALRRTRGGPREFARSIALFAPLLIAQGDYTLTQAYLSEALEIYERLNDRPGIARTWQALGLVSCRQRDLVTARQSIEKSLSLFEALGARRHVALSHQRLGQVAFCDRDFTRARKELETSLEEHRALGEKREYAIALLYLADVDQSEGVAPRARARYREALDFFVLDGSLLGQVYCLEGLARVDAGEGRLLRAARLVGATDQLREQLGTPTPPTWSDEKRRCWILVRRQLGKEAANLARKEGRSMRLGQVVADATSDA